MSSGNQRYINTAGTHNITMGDDFINVSTSVGAITLVFPNIRDSGAINLNKVWFVNDVDDMAATNNVTIVASDTSPATELNGGSSVVLDTNGFSAEIVPSGYYNYMVNSGTSEGGMTGSGTLNYVAKFTPSGTVLGNSQLFDNGTGVGIGTTSVSANYFSVSGGNQPTAYFQSNASSVTGYALRLYADSPNTSQNVGLFVEASGGSQNYAVWVNEGLSGFGGTNSVSKVYIKGTDATTSNYSLKVDNSASAPLFYVRNDGNVAIGTATPTAGTRFHVYRAVNDFLYEVKIENPTNGISAAAAMLIQSDSGKMEFGQLSSLFTSFTGYGQTGDTFIRSGTGARNMNFLTDASNVGKFLFFSRLNPTADATTPSLAIDGLKVGIGTNTMTSSLQVIGLVEYADNAAALTAGLTIGAFYRTGDLLKICH